MRAHVLSEAETLNEIAIALVRAGIGLDDGQRVAGKDRQPLVDQRGYVVQRRATQRLDQGRQGRTTARIAPSVPSLAAVNAAPTSSSANARTSAPPGSAEAAAVGRACPSPRRDHLGRTSAPRRATYRRAEAPTRRPGARPAHCPRQWRRPPFRVAASAASIVSCEPTHSKTTSAPSGRIRSATVAARGAVTPSAVSRPSSGRAPPELGRLDEKNGSSPRARATSAVKSPIAPPPITTARSPALTSARATA